jgi:MerR family transcriptional regulator, heat shock protein HspR
MKENTLTIGKVARKLGIHEQTIRAYEKKGLIKPKRTEKRSRIFQEHDITRIIIIITLTQELGLTLTGVNILFNFARTKQVSDEELLEFIEDHRNELYVSS